MSVVQCVRRMAVGWWAEKSGTTPALTEALREMRPTGADRWIFDLCVRYGMRDGLYCCYGRWIVLFASKKIPAMTIAERTSLNFAAGLVVFRLIELAKNHRRRSVRSEPTLTARGHAVLYG